MFVWPLSSIPSNISTARPTSSRRRDTNSPSAVRVRSTNARETDDFDIERARCSTHGDSLRVVFSLYTHDFDDLFLHQFGEDAEPDTDRQGQHPSLATPASSPAAPAPEPAAHPARPRPARLVPDRLLHGSSSFELRRIASHAPQRNGRSGRTASSKFYEPRDNLFAEVVVTMSRTRPSSGSARSLPSARPGCSAAREVGVHKQTVGG